jgi:hypothetical protein
MGSVADEAHRSVKLITYLARMLHERLNQTEKKSPIFVVDSTNEARPATSSI